MNKFFVKKINCILIFSIIILFITVLFPTKNYSSINSDLINGKDIVCKNNMTIIDSFDVNENYDRIGMLLSSNQQYVKKGYVYIELYENGNLKKKKKIKASNVVDDNYYFKYYYIKNKFKKNNKYEIKITFKNLDSKLLLKTTNDKKFNDSMNIDDLKNENVMALSFLQVSKNYFNIWYCLLIIALLLSFKVLVVKERKHE